MSVWFRFIRRLPSSDTSVTDSDLTSVLSPRVRKARLAQLDVMDCRVLWVCLAQQDHPEYLGRMETRCVSQWHTSPKPRQLSDCEFQSRASDRSWFPDLVLSSSAVRCFFFCRVRLESTVRKVPREEKESM